MTDSESDSREEAFDPRVYFAAERTLLAWVRTGLAMMGFGFVVARFGAFFREMAAIQRVPAPAQSEVSLWVGLALVIAGVIVNAAAAYGHHRTVRRLERGQPLRMRALSMGICVAVLLAVLGLAIALYLLLGLNVPRP